MRKPGKNTVLAMALHMATLASSIATVAGTTVSADSAFSVAGIFSNHMVLQRERPVPVWGEAAPGTKVSVRLGDVAAEAVAGPDGEWCATLPVMAARNEGGTLSVAADGGAAGEAVFTDVLVGDVWLCGGQSNMAFGTHAVIGAEEEAARAADFPDVRVVKIEKCREPSPVKRIRCGKWDVCTPDRLLNKASGVTAVGYFFARMLNGATGVPQGIIHDNWAGCKIQPFIPIDALKGVPQLETLLDEDDKGAATMFNAMVAPIARFPIAGALWYQGESNVGNANYLPMLKALAGGWRKAWGYDFPFCVFQLSSIRDPDPNPAQNWPRARTRDDQRRAAEEIPDCGLVVTMDVGATHEHPLNKRDVGERAALWALHRVYGRKDIVPSGPMFDGFTREGDRLRVKFRFASDGGGLVAAEKDPEKPGVAPVPKDTTHVMGFTVQDENGKWHTANAVIDGDCVIVSAPGVKNPKNVRYAHVYNTMGIADLYNAAGLPAAAFRTDAGKAGTNQERKSCPDSCRDGDAGS